MNNIKTTKLLAIGIIVMGFVHIAATFTPMIADKLTPLNEGMQQACIYFSLMCGALLILGGCIVHQLCGKSNEHSFLRMPLLLTYTMLAVDGILAVCFMPHNPCAWVILVISILLLVVSRSTKTDRILLRQWQDKDAESLYKYASDPDVGDRAGWPPHKSVEESLHIIQTIFNNPTTWAIEWKETGEAIGAIGYGSSCDCNLPVRDGEPIVGYWIAKPYWNKGICTESLQLMLEHIRKTTNFKSLLSSHFIDNPASGRVMEKCGFKPTGDTAFDESLYHGFGRPMRVLRLEIRR